MKKISKSRFLVNDDITLKLCELEDAEAMFAVVDANRAHLREWLAWLDYNMSVEDSLDFIRNSTCSYMQGARYNFGIFYQGELVGTIGLVQLLGEVNLGYWLAQAHQGKGIITICAKYLTHLALTALGVNRVIIRCASENHKSRAVPERLGFKHEGTAREAELLYDRFVDLEVYSFLKGDLGKWEKK